jgi:hypothetical protein
MFGLSSAASIVSASIKMSLASARMSNEAGAGAGISDVTGRPLAAQASNPP